LLLLLAMSGGGAVKSPSGNRKSSSVVAALKEKTKQGYKGETKDGIRHGMGQYTYPVGGNAGFSYNGEWCDGIKQGVGTFTAPGMTYTGRFENGEITGMGTKRWDDGRSYTGDLCFGEMHGKGRWTHSETGESYDGQFEDNKRRGQGVFQKNGFTYQGAFDRHKFNGKGTFLKEGVFVLKGENFFDDIVQGRASVTWHKAASLTCESWTNGRPFCQKGVYTCLDGSYDYEGAVVNCLLEEKNVASYFFSTLDRAAVAAKEEEEAAAKAAEAAAASAAAAGGKAAPPAKKAPPPAAAKKGEAVAAPTGTSVPQGGDFGIINVKAGGAGLIAEATAAAIAAAAAAPAGKGAKGGAPAADAGPVIVPNPVPPSLSLPCERKRLALLELRPVLSGGDGGSEKVLGDPVPLWLRKQSLEEQSSDVCRFPPSSIVYVGGKVVKRHESLDKGLPSPELALEGGAANNGPGDDEVSCLSLPADASLSFSILTSELIQATEQMSFCADFKFDAAQVAAAYQKQKQEKEAAAAVAAAEAEAAAIAAAEEAERVRAEREALGLPPEDEQQEQELLQGLTEGIGQDSILVMAQEDGDGNMQPETTIEEEGKIELDNNNNSDNNNNNNNSSSTASFAELGDAYHEVSVFSFTRRLEEDEISTSKLELALLVPVADLLSSLPVVEATEQEEGEKLQESTASDTAAAAAVDGTAASSDAAATATSCVWKSCVWELRLCSDSSPRIICARWYDSSELTADKWHAVALTLRAPPPPPPPPPASSSSSSSDLPLGAAASAAEEEEVEAAFVEGEGEKEETELVEATQSATQMTPSSSSSSFSSSPCIELVCDGHYKPFRGKGVSNEEQGIVLAWLPDRPPLKENSAATAAAATAAEAIAAATAAKEASERAAEEAAAAETAAAEAVAAAQAVADAAAAEGQEQQQQDEEVVAVASAATAAAAAATANAETTAALAAEAAAAAEAATAAAEATAAQEAEYERIRLNTRLVIRTGGKGFAGAVKSVAVASQADRLDVYASTSCFALHREKEASWEAFKKQEQEARQLALEEKLAAEVRAQAEEEAKVKAEQEAERLASFGGDEEAAAAATATAAATTAAEAEAAAAAQGAEEEETSPPPPPPPPPPQASPVPFDCSELLAAPLYLACGEGETRRLRLPLETPPGNYVLTVRDGVLEACRTSTTTTTPPPPLAAAGEAKVEGEGEGEELEHLKALTPADVTGMVAAVRTVPLLAILNIVVPAPAIVESE